MIKHILVNIKKKRKTYKIIIKIFNNKKKFN